MLDTLSGIFLLGRDREGSPTRVFGELPDAIETHGFPEVDDQPKLTSLGEDLVVLARHQNGDTVGFVFAKTPSATELPAAARKLAALAASGAIAPPSSPSGKGEDKAAALLAASLAGAPRFARLNKLLTLCCDAIVTAGLAEEAAIVFCKPGSQATLALSSLRLAPVRDNISGLFEGWRGKEICRRRITPASLEEGSQEAEDTVLLMDKLGQNATYLSIPPVNEAGFGFLLFGPEHEDPEPHLNRLRQSLEIRHPTRRDWSKRRSILKRAWIAAAAFAAIFLLLPTDQSVAGSGITQPRDVEVISVHFATYLETVHVDIGETVEAGTAIAQLGAPDQIDAQSEVLLQISVEQAAANSALADDDYGTYVLAQRRADLQQTRLEQIESRLERLNPTTHQGGRVISALSDGERGRHLPAGTEIARVQSSDAFNFKLTLTAVDASLIAQGQTGTLSLRGQLDETYPVRIVTPPTAEFDDANPSADPLITAIAEIELDDGDRILSGLSGFAHINTGRRIRIWVWSRHIIEYLRMKAWTVLNWQI